MIIDFNRYNGGGSGSGSTDLTNYWNSAVTEEHIESAASIVYDSATSYADAAVAGVDAHIEDVEEVTASALTELHTGLLEVSGRSQFNPALYTPTSGFSTINGSAITAGGNLVIQGGGGSGSESVVELTQAQYDALTAYSEDTTYVITDAEPINLDIYATSADTASISGAVDTLSGVVATKATKASVSANNARQFPKWNAEGIVTGTTGSTAYEQSLNINGAQKTMLQTSNSSFGTIYAPTAAGTQNQILQSNGSGAPVWSSYKFVFISQTDYDAITTKDTTTIYFITGD